LDLDLGDIKFDFLKKGLGGGGGNKEAEQKLKEKEA